MATTTDRDTGKRARVPLRMTEDQKALLQRAATIEGTSLSDFVTRNAEDAARRTMREHGGHDADGARQRGLCQGAARPTGP
jgi:uncharacterized protein (DUF1778 family)